MVLQGLGTAVCAPVPYSFDHSFELCCTGPQSPLRLCGTQHSRDLNNVPMCLKERSTLHGQIRVIPLYQVHLTSVQPEANLWAAMRPRPHRHYTLSDLPFPHPRAKLPQYPQHVHMLMTIANQHVHATHMPTARHSLSFQLKRTS